MNLWLIFALMGPMFWGCSNALDSAVRRNFVKNDMVATWLLALSRIPVVLAIFLILGLNIPNISITILMIFSGFIWLLPFIYYYRAIEFEDPSKVALLMQLTPIFTAGFAFILMREMLSPPQVFAFAMLIIAGALASLKKLEGVWRISKATGIIVLAGIVWAFADVFFKKIAPEFNGYWIAMGYNLSGGLLFALIFLLPSQKKIIFSSISGLPKRVWKIIVANLFIGLIGTLSFGYALTIGKASLTTVIIGTQPLFAFIFGLLLSKIIPEVQAEELSKKSLFMKAGSFVFVIIGLVLLQSF